MLIDREDSILLLIDMQEKLVPAIQEGGDCVATAARLLAVARLLDVPVVVTEHMPDAIGSTVGPLLDDVSPQEIVAKRHFSAVRETGFLERLNRHAPRERIVVCGTEAHVCVMQTALDLADEGFAVAVVEDAVGSRYASDRASALDRMRDAGLTLTTAETVMFEWAGRGDAPEFRRVLSIVKDRD